MNSGISESHQDENDPRIGETFAGQYRVESSLGAGGVGKVYRATQLSLGKSIALKLLHPHLSGDREVAKRFHREAKAASRLAHPNSVHVIDFGQTEDGTLFLVMELLEGQTLQRLIETESPMSPQRIESFMSQILAALTEAHESHIIHRDLKPENVMVLRDRSGKEHIKVCDFGMAKIAEEEVGTSAITREGFVCGTPEYMAPEQARGDALDARVDIYAAGVILYQFLTGERPFEANTPLGIITKHLVDPPDPPQERQPSWAIPEQLAAITLKAMEKAREARFDSALKMRKAIQRAVKRLGAKALVRMGNTETVATSETATPTQDVMRQLFKRSERRRWFVWLAVSLSALCGIALTFDPSNTGSEISTTSDNDEYQSPRTEPLSPPAPTVVQTQPPNPADVPSSATPESAEPAEANASRASTTTTTRRRQRAKRRARPEIAPATMPPEPVSDNLPENTPEAVETGSEALASEPPRPSPLIQGQRHFRSGNYREALRALQRAEREMPQNADVYRYLYRTYERLHRYPEAVGACERYRTLVNPSRRVIVDRTLENLRARAAAP